MTLREIIRSLVYEDLGAVVLALAMVALVLNARPVLSFIRDCGGWCI